MTPQETLSFSHDRRHLTRSVVLWPNQGAAKATATGFTGFTGSALHSELMVASKSQQVNVCSRQLFRCNLQFCFQLTASSNRLFMNRRELDHKRFSVMTLSLLAGEAESREKVRNLTGTASVTGWCSRFKTRHKP